MKNKNTKNAIRWMSGLPGRVGSWLATLLVAVCMMASPAKAAQGPIVLMGIDAADGWEIGTHGPESEYLTVITNMLVRVSNGGSGLLVVGAGKSPTDSITTLWSQIAADAGVPITLVNGAANIAAQSFAGFAQIVVIADEFEVLSGGLTQAENDALALRAADIATFWNGGGGVFGLTSDFFLGAGPYAWFSGIGPVTASIFQGYVDVTATPAGATIGLDDTTMDVTFWHDTYLTYPAFMSVLMTRTDNGQAAVIGFLPVPPQVVHDPPTIECPADITVATDEGVCEAVVVYPYPVVTVDPECEPATVTCVPPSGSTFPIGVTEAVCIVTDACGQAALCTFKVIVVDQEGPVVDCLPTVNPAGKTVPKAGDNPKSGQNPDGFYELVAYDNCDGANLAIYVKDSSEGPCGGAFAAGPYAPGTKVKLTQSPGQQSVKPMAGVITAHINTKGEPVLVVTDSAGNTTCHKCFVPPLPK